MMRSQLFAAPQPADVGLNASSYSAAAGLYEEIGGPGQRGRRRAAEGHQGAAADASRAFIGLHAKCMAAGGGRNGWRRSRPLIRAPAITSRRGTRCRRPAGTSRRPASGRSPDKRPLVHVFPSLSYPAQLAVYNEARMQAVEAMNTYQESANGTIRGEFQQFDGTVPTVDGAAASIAGGAPAFPGGGVGTGRRSRRRSRTGRRLGGGDSSARRHRRRSAGRRTPGRRRRSGPGGQRPPGSPARTRPGTPGQVPPVVPPGGPGGQPTPGQNGAPNAGHRGVSDAASTAPGPGFPPGTNPGWSRVQPRGPDVGPAASVPDRHRCASAPANPGPTPANGAGGLGAAGSTSAAHRRWAAGSVGVPVPAVRRRPGPAGRGTQAAVLAGPGRSRGVLAR